MEEESAVEIVEKAAEENTAKIAGCGVLCGVDCNENNTFEQKRAALKQEDELLQKIIETQSAVRNAVLKREWTDFETLNGELEAYKEQFEALEAERLALFGTVPDAEGKTPHFYTMVSRLPEDEREDLSELYRSIKDRALKVQIANEALLLYLTEARSTVGDFMKAAFPDRKGGVYSRQGRKVSSDMRSLVLDQIL
ncbi:MAG: hypothetical protein LBP19_10515 [Treponema sp.]|jgi:hypothetical protein|nr:hypothetical protein [Treponema sp.]